MPNTKRADQKKSEKAVSKSAATSLLSCGVVDIEGKKQGTVRLPKHLFAAPVVEVLLAQAVRVYLANQRRGTASTKTRGEVEGSTSKIYRQKGTGRARHGSIRAPIFVGGGIVFGPKPRRYTLGLSKKLRRAALASALTKQYQENNIIIVEGLGAQPLKTKTIARMLFLLKVPSSALLVTPKEAELVVRAVRNIPGVEYMPASQLHAYTVLSHKKLLFMKESLSLLQETFVGNPPGTDRRGLQK
ncbi:50S ribosomal protein L4 [Patescibacteria group bacterium]|nr:50S ribosomal protein L4 [Patescibacteria group bacterium]MBU1472304.1 50S ribosomal protein L4 [Patescibacteria group bacterium]MBU2460445.1 50S ribosomal protein L4 [Patescibacteria group bacterium]MBU2543980.1 50S ribosomal protein L4 [Patescibacteria group bacterium]